MDTIYVVSAPADPYRAQDVRKNILVTNEHEDALRKCADVPYSHIEVWWNGNLTHTVSYDQAVNDVPD